MASPTVEDMRDMIAGVYKGPAWKEKVRDMSDRQVMAVYFNFCEKGKFDKPSKKRSEQPKKEKSRGFYLDEDDYAAEQLYLDFN